MDGRHWLDVAKIEEGGPFGDRSVEEVKEMCSAMGLLPFKIVYWSVYTPIGSLYYSQGCQMNYYVDSFKFPIAAICASEHIVILSLVPLMNRVVYPWLTRSGYSFRMLHRIGTGFAFMAAAMIVAGLVEFWRKNTETTDIVSTCDSDIYLSELSVFWQIPQYVLCGVSQMFLIPAGFAFFSSQSPPCLKSTAVSLTVAMTGVGYLFGALLTALVDWWTPEWITTDLDDGHLEYFFYLLAALMVTATVFFVPFARGFVYKPDTTDWIADDEDPNGYVQLETDDNSSPLV